MICNIGRILQERENHDLELEKRRKDSENLRETYMQSIKLITTNVGEGLKDFITDEGKLKNFAITTTAIAFGTYICIVFGAWGSLGHSIVCSDNSILY